MCLCNTMSPAAKIVRKNYLKHKGNRESHKVIDLGVKIASLVQKWLPDMKSLCLRIQKFWLRFKLKKKYCKTLFIREDFYFHVNSRDQWHAKIKSTPIFLM